MAQQIKVVVPWHNKDQLADFLAAWEVEADDPRLHLEQDSTQRGCALTKNSGIEKAIAAGADIIIVLDDDCYPHDGMSLDSFIFQHFTALAPQKVEMFQVVTDPPSRGTPYFNRSITMPVAASMGFWTGVGDYDAPGQLVHGATKPMTFDQRPIHGRYFPLCGMNLAFRASEWPWCQFINVPRFDDIWQGFLWQKKAYAYGQCFNLNGPLVRHSRQSNVWANLRDETLNLERNETIWQKIHALPLDAYDQMKAVFEVRVLN